MTRLYGATFFVRLARLPVARTSLLLLVLFGILIQYGRTHFYRDPLSVFYNEKYAFVRWYSDVRERQATLFLHEAQKGDGAHPKAGAKPSVCAVFLTVKRDKIQYIDVCRPKNTPNTQYLPDQNAIASALEGLTKRERTDLHLAVIFAHTDPTVHPTYGKPWLRQLVDDAPAYNSSQDLGYIKRLEETGDFATKGVLDYAHALDYCHRSGAPWVMVFEGDILLADGWFAQTLKGLRRIRDEMGKLPDRWIYMRLFNQERSTGWSSTRVGEHHEPQISLAVSAVVFVVAQLFRFRFPKVRAYLDGWSVALVCGLAVPGLVVLFFQAGKASTLPPLPGVREEYFGCCSQGLLFPQEQVPGLIEYLHAKGSGQVDLMINDYARSKGLARMSLYPVQMQHMGLQSVRKTTKSDARAIWSMAFETLAAAKVRTEHLKLVAELYGSVDTV